MNAPETNARIAELEEQLRQRDFELEVLAELSQKINYPLSDKELLILLLEQIHKALPIDVCAGLLTLPQGSCDFILRPLRPLGPGIDLDIQCRLAESFQLMTGEPVACDLAAAVEVMPTDFNAPEASPSSAPTLVSQTQTAQTQTAQTQTAQTPTMIHTLGSVFFVPMIVESAVVGMLLIATEAIEAFNQAHIHFLYTVANQGAISLQRLRSHLRAEKQRLESIVANLPAGVLLLDSEWKIAIANPSAHAYLAQLTALEPQAPLTSLGERALTDWLDPLQALAQPLSQSAEIPQPVWREVIAPDNPDRVFDVGIQPIALAEQPSRWLMVIRDISDRKATERFKDELIAVIAHELRTPLSLIEGPLGLLATGELGTLSEPGQQILDVATEGLERLSRVVRDVVDFAHFDSGQVKLVKQQCWTSDIVTRAVQANTSAALEAKVTLETQVTDVAFWADSNYIMKAVGHFINNAIKFSAAQNHVWISTELENETQTPQIVFKVRDQGAGIPADKLSLIFGRFRQADMSSTRAGNGLGLGLTVCQLIAQSHGGKVLVESVAGEGSLFCLTLPQFPS